ncbi:MAG: hypothetical protein ACYCQJ_07130 [Nitrososphaerales archaeon]
MTLQNNVLLGETRQRVLKAIETLRSSNVNFEHAYDTYTKQYRMDAIGIFDPLNLSESIEPLLIVVGRNTSLQYYSSTRLLKGSTGSLTLKNGFDYIIGRRQPQDSKVVLWCANTNEEIEIAEYNPQSGTIPSRVHGAFCAIDPDHVMYTDLASSSGTVIVGEKPHSAFVRVYDPGSDKLPRIKFERINMERKD